MRNLLIVSATLENKKAMNGKKAAMQTVSLIQSKVIQKKMLLVLVGRLC
jgi:hypothetical protein